MKLKIIENIMVLEFKYTYYYVYRSYRYILVCFDFFQKNEPLIHKNVFLRQPFI